MINNIRPVPITGVGNIKHKILASTYIIAGTIGRLSCRVSSTNCLHLATGPMAQKGVSRKVIKRKIINDQIPSPAICASVALFHWFLNAHVTTANTMATTVVNHATLLAIRSLSVGKTKEVRFSFRRGKDRKPNSPVICSKGIPASNCHEVCSND